MTGSKKEFEALIARLRRKAEIASMDECKFCKQPIMWKIAYTKQGEKSTPLEPKEVKAESLSDGDWILTPEGKWHKITGERLATGFYRDFYGWLRHNCTQRE